MCKRVKVPLQIKLPGVPVAKQGREVPPQWEWTEGVVWPERMLATLEGGIKGGKWPSEMAPCLLRRIWVNLLSLDPKTSGQRSSWDPLTGELDALCGAPHKMRENRLSGSMRGGVTRSLA